MATKKRGHGEGALFRRADGRWVSRVTTGFDSNGRQKTRTQYSKTKAEAQEKLRLMQNAKMAGELVAPNQQTVVRYIGDWLQTSAPDVLQVTSIMRAESVFRLHLTPFLGNTKLKSIRPDQIRKLMADLREAGRTDSTRHRAFALLRRVFNVALREGLIPSNPCSRVDSPRYDPPEANSLSEEQVQKLLAAAEGHRWEAFIVLAIAGGFRISEMLALRWQDIDLERGTVAIKHTLEAVGGKYRLKAPKTRAGVRTVAVGLAAVDALHRHRANLMREGLAGGDIVFPSTSGDWQHRSAFHKIWSKLRESAGIPKTTRFHDLRHTSASMLLLANIHPRVMQSRLGHSNINVTMKTYSHVTAQMDQGAADAADAILGPISTRAGVNRAENGAG